jgi:hypothetical protein
LLVAAVCIANSNALAWVKWQAPSTYCKSTPREDSEQECLPPTIAKLAKDLQKGTDAWNLKKAWSCMVKFGLRQSDICPCGRPYKEEAFIAGVEVRDRARITKGHVLPGGPEGTKVCTYMQV